jgi:hypothetical protein
MLRRRPIWFWTMADSACTNVFCLQNELHLFDAKLILLVFRVCAMPEIEPGSSKRPCCLSLPRPGWGQSRFNSPEHFAADVIALDDFLRQWPHELRVSFEFRYPSWFSGDVSSVLRRHKRGALSC